MHLDISGICNLFMLIGLMQIRGGKFYKSLFIKYINLNPEIVYIDQRVHQLDIQNSDGQEIHQLQIQTLNDQDIFPLTPVFQI